MATQTKGPLKIKTYEEDANLREVGWNQLFLEKAKEEHKLKHREAVLYINAARDRFRLVACFYGMAVLILPPTAAEARLSLYLQVSQFLRKFQIDGKANAHLAEEMEHCQRRIEIRKKRAAKARRKRGK